MHHVMTNPPTVIVEVSISASKTVGYHVITASPGVGVLPNQPGGLDFRAIHRPVCLYFVMEMGSSYSFDASDPVDVDDADSGHTAPWQNGDPQFKTLLHSGNATEIAIEYRNWTGPHGHWPSSFYALRFNPPLTGPDPQIKNGSVTSQPPNVRGGRAVGGPCPML